MNRQNEGKREAAIAYIEDKIGVFYDKELRDFLCSIVKEFQDHPGSSTHHHGYRHGLLIHTAEVLKASLHLGIAMGAATSVVMAAAIMHDWGKIYDYEEIRGSLAMINGSDYRKRPGYQKAAHTIASYDRWQDARSLFACPSYAGGMHDRVGKCILSHHGQLDWGSVLTPSTPEEWCLHLADMASANVGVTL